MSEEETPKSIFVVASCDTREHKDEKGNTIRFHGYSRPWSFWETQELAIESGIFGWSSCEALWESGYYTHVVVEEISLNFAEPNYYKDNRVWFKFVPEEAHKREDNIRKAIVKCECPDEFNHIIGFY